MRNFVLAVTILLIVLPFQLVWAQLTETRPLPTFKAVKNMGSMKVILQKGNQESATIQSEKVELADIATEVSEGELQIHFKPKVKIGWNSDNN